MFFACKVLQGRLFLSEKPAIAAPIAYGPISGCRELACIVLSIGPRSPLPALSLIAPSASSPRLLRSVHPLRLRRLTRRLAFATGFDCIGHGQWIWDRPGGCQTSYSCENACETCLNSFQAASSASCSTTLLGSKSMSSAAHLLEHTFARIWFVRQLFQLAIQVHFFAGQRLGYLHVDLHQLISPCQSQTFQAVHASRLC